MHPRHKPDIFARSQFHKMFSKIFIIYILIYFLIVGEESYSPSNGTTNSIILSGSMNNSSTNTSLSSSNVPSSQSVQQLCLQQQSQMGQNGNSGGLVPHSQSAYEIGQVPLTPLAQHQQALHQQLQQRFANANSNSGEFINIFNIDDVCRVNHVG